MNANPVNKVDGAPEGPDLLQAPPQSQDGTAVPFLLYFPLSKPSGIDMTSS